VLCHDIVLYEFMIYDLALSLNKKRNVHHFASLCHNGIVEFCG